MTSYILKNEFTSSTGLYSNTLKSYDTSFGQGDYISLVSVRTNDIFKMLGKIYIVNDRADEFTWTFSDVNINVYDTTTLLTLLNNFVNNGDIATNIIGEFKYDSAT